MQSIYLSLIVNVILMIAVLSLMFKGKLIHWYNSKKILRETQEKQRIQKIVLEYLKQLQNDGTNNI